MQRERIGTEPGPTVLLVGLEEAFGALLEHELGLRGFAVERVQGGRDALARWSDPPGAVVLSLDDDGDMDALEFAQVVASDEGPPLIACTRARVGAEVDAEALQALGIHAVVARPCHIDALADAVDEAVEIRRLAPRSRFA